MSARSCPAPGRTDIRRPRIRSYRPSRPKRRRRFPSRPWCGNFVASRDDPSGVHVFIAGSEPATRVRGGRGPAPPNQNPVAAPYGRRAGPRRGRTRRRGRAPRIRARIVKAPVFRELTMVEPPRRTTCSRSRSPQRHPWPRARSRLMSRSTCRPWGRTTLRCSCSPSASNPPQTIVRCPRPVAASGTSEPWVHRSCSSTTTSSLRGCIGLPSRSARRRRPILQRRASASPTRPPCGTNGSKVPRRSQRRSRCRSWGRTGVRRLGLPPRPRLPRSIIWLPVQTAVCQRRGVGAPVVVVGLHVSETGS